MDGEGKGGCGVVSLALGGLAVLVLVVLLVNALGSLSDAESSRMYAQAALQDAWGRSQAQVILAEGQARLDSAQAFAVTAGASLPWLVMGVVGVAFAALLASIVAIFSLALATIRQPQPQALPAPQVRVLPGPARLALPELHEPDGVIFDDALFSLIERK